MNERVKKWLVDLVAALTGWERGGRGAATFFFFLPEKPNRQQRYIYPRLSSLVPSHILRVIICEWYFAHFKVVMPSVGFTTAETDVSVNPPQFPNSVDSTTDLSSGKTKNYPTL